MNRTLEKLRKGFTDFGRVTRNDGELLYSSLCDIILRSDKLLTLADMVPLDQPFANIVLGSIHFLLLKGYKSDLSEYYATVTYNTRPVDSRLEVAVLGFVDEYWEKLVELCKSKKVQTNEIGRCSFLLPGLNFLADVVDQPIILLELGTSAGLLLNYDSYAIRYSTIGNVAGNQNSLVLIECEVRGDNNPPVMSIPKINRKIGIDLEPLKCSDSDDALWLQALVWPKNLKRFERLRGALEICRENQSCFELVKGDGFEDITNYLDEYTDDNSVICIYHSFAINQITKEAREEYYNKLKAYSVVNKMILYELRILWKDNDGTELVLQEITEGTVKTHRLADVHHHGKWIEWLIES